MGTAKEVVGEIIAGVLDADNITVDASVVEYLASALEECSGEEDLRSVVATLVPEFLASYGVDDFIASASVCEKIVESLKEGKSKESDDDASEVDERSSKKRGRKNRKKNKKKKKRNSRQRSKRGNDDDEDGDDNDTDDSDAGKISDDDSDEGSENSGRRGNAGAMRAADGSSAKQSQSASCSPFAAMSSLGKCITSSVVGLIAPRVMDERPLPSEKDPPELSFRGKPVLCVNIHGTTQLEQNPYISHPIVKVHCVNAATGMYIRKTDDDKGAVSYFESQTVMEVDRSGLKVNVRRESSVCEYIMPIATPPCPVGPEGRFGAQPRWSEEDGKLLWRENYSSFMKSDSLLLFGKSCFSSTFLCSMDERHG